MSILLCMRWVSVVYISMLRNMVRIRGFVLFIVLLMMVVMRYSGMMMMMLVVCMSSVLMCLLK